ncbi:MAG: hypothetical protein IPP48_08820 [Chitinophagaceae bacterium]|nr:hypothetical protein [Chitinophagaceae bacterium]
MNKNEKIEKLIEQSLNSFDNTARATPKPYLLTRLNTRLQSNNSGWDTALRFLSKPIVAAVCICLVVTVNAVVLVNNINVNKSTADEQYSDEEYNTSVAVLNELENIEP